MFDRAEGARLCPQDQPQCADLLRLGFATAALRSPKAGLNIAMTGRDQRRGLCLGGEGFRQELLGKSPGSAAALTTARNWRNRPRRARKG